MVILVEGTLEEKEYPLTHLPAGISSCRSPVPGASSIWERDPGPCPCDPG